MNQTTNPKRVLVTGSGTGIGREIALEFARQGADVVLHYSRNDEGARSAVQEIRAMNRRAEAFQANFDDVTRVQSLGQQAINFLGGVDCLVNNAGITFNRPFRTVTPEQFDAVYNVNIRAQFFPHSSCCGRHVETRRRGDLQPYLHPRRSGAPEHSVYAGTKGAIIAYTRSLAVELAQKGIRVNAIAPGWVTVEIIPRRFLASTRGGAQGAYEKVRWAAPAKKSRSRNWRCFSAPKPRATSSARRSLRTGARPR